MSSADARDIHAIDLPSEDRPSEIESRRQSTDSPGEQHPVRDRLDVSAKGEQRDTSRKDPDKSPEQADTQPKDNGPTGLSWCDQKTSGRDHRVPRAGSRPVSLPARMWYLSARHYESTDDAFIDGRPVLISPQVTGNIVQVNVTDNQPVKVERSSWRKIDPRDYQAAVDQAAAQIRQAEATMKTLTRRLRCSGRRSSKPTSRRSKPRRAAEFLAGRKQALSGSRQHRRRHRAARPAGFVRTCSGQAGGLAAASAGKISAERQIDVLEAQKAVAAAQLDQRRAQKDRADADLSRTELRATADGRIAKLTAAVGALAAPAQSIMVVVPLDVWVTANFKESQLADMRVGQPVTISIDAFGRSFPGHVDGIQAGSGTAFSLLPTENATGNYVKVVQRVPVKITFDRRPEVELGPGMSVVPTVTVRPVSGMSGMPDATAANQSEYGNANPWLIAILVSVATFMEVLDTTIANVALRYISGGLAVSSDEASWVITTYLVANSIVLCASGWIAKMFGRKNFFHRQHRAVHCQLAAVRLRLEPAIAAGVSGDAGIGGWRHDAGGAIHSGRRVSAGQTQPGVCPLWRRCRGGAGGRADPRRLAQRQRLLALVLPDQCAGRPDLAGIDLFHHSKLPRSQKEERAKLWAKGPEFRHCGFHPGCDVSPARWKSCWTGDRLTIGSRSSFILTFAGRDLGDRVSSVRSGGSSIARSR